MVDLTHDRRAGICVRLLDLVPERGDRLESRAPAGVVGLVVRSVTSLGLPSLRSLSGMQDRHAGPRDVFDLSGAGGGQTWPLEGSGASPRPTFEEPLKLR